MKIGERIHARRIEIGISAEELGKRIGKDRATIFRYENGDISNIPVSMVPAIAEALEMKPSELVSWAEAPSKSDPSTSLDQRDTDRLEALHQNPRLGLLFDRQRKMKAEDIDFMIQMAERIIRERDGDD